MQQATPELSPEIWSYILEHAYSKLEGWADNWCFSQERLQLPAREAAAFHCLRQVSSNDLLSAGIENLHQVTICSQVCKAFNQIFLDTPHWFENMCLPLDYQTRGTRLSSYLTWTGHHKCKVQNCAVADPAVALPALLCRNSRLRKVHLRITSQHSLSILPSFAALSSCSLQRPRHDRNTWSLLPLSALGSLTGLVLEHGFWQHLDGLQYLSSLCLNHARVQGSAICTFANSLQSLWVYQSHLSLPQGLGACQSLQSLTCMDSGVFAHADMDSLITTSTATSIPTDLSRLTSLSELHMVLPLSPVFEVDEEFSLGWLTHFTALHTLRFTTELPVILSASLSRLTNLSRLELHLHSGTYPSRLLVDWEELISLRVLLLECKVCEFDHRLLKLATVKTLCTFESYMCPGDISSAQYFAHLVHCFKQHAPGVELIFDRGHSDKILAEAFP